MNAYVKAAVGIILVIVLGVFLLSRGLIGKNEIQNFQVVQSLGGNISINSKGGYYSKFFPTVWNYPKIRNVYFSRDKREGSPVDESIEIRFKNKGTGFVSTRVTYKLFGGKDAVMAMHENCAGDTEIADSIVLAKLKEVARIKGSELTSSEVVEKQESFITDIRKDMIGNMSLAKMGIIVEKVELTSVDFDSETLKLFKAQQKAILLGKEAEANKIKYDMQLKETDAKYKQQIAEEKGKAEMQKMKAVTDAQREAELAKIEAQKKVTVAELEKKEALVKQQRIVEVSELIKKGALVDASKKEEVARIELVQAKLDAQSKIELARAKQKEVELSGAITEKERILAEIDANRQIGVAKNIAESIRGTKLPDTVIIGESKGDGNLMKMWLLKQIQGNKPLPAKTPVK
ncbi:MAG: hypothetical protein GY750_10340 [Lentisphaerae bacterium]|nr:hypothetical protein [Lentisphaerota bacterium]MCP4101809.1 hypothetical protein [Lentisphaerota bacterium]